MLESEGGRGTHQNKRFSPIAVTVVDLEASSQVTGRVCMGSIRAILTGEIHHLRCKLG